MTTTDDNNVFEKLVSILGSQEALADACEVSPQAVTKWKKRGIPAKRVKQIVAVTGGQVSATDMRPDIF